MSQYGNTHFMSVDMAGNVAPLVPIKKPGLNKEQAIAFAAWMLVMAQATKDDICKAMDVVSGVAQ